MVFGVLAVKFHNAAGYTPASTHLSFVRDLSLGVGVVGFPVLAYLIISARMRPGRETVLTRRSTTATAEPAA